MGLNKIFDLSLCQGQYSPIPGEIIIQEHNAWKKDKSCNQCILIKWKPGGITRHQTAEIFWINSFCCRQPNTKMGNKEKTRRCNDGPRQQRCVTSSLQQPAYQCSCEQDEVIFPLAAVKAGITEQIQFI